MVYLRVETERLESGKKMQVASALLIFVALGADGRPTQVPPILPETEAEKLRYRQSELRYSERQKLRAKERALQEAGSEG